MPRAPRIDIPGLLHHVMVRGINRCDIFTDDDDRYFFVRRFSSLLQETTTSCLAWALMPNHFHILIRPSKVKLAKFMGRLLTGYAAYFNHRHGRSGHLFQNRYKSLVCQEDDYLLELVRYIHLNPLRGHIVQNLGALARHRWSGHSVVMGKQDLDGQDFESILALFGQNRAEARRQYHCFVADGIPQGRRNDLVGRLTEGGQGLSCIADSRILGPLDFVEEIRRQEPEIRHVEARKPIAEIVTTVAKEKGIPVRAIAAGSRSEAVVAARSIVCRTALEEGHSAAEIARYLGLSRYGVAVAGKRAESLAQPDHEVIVT